MSSNSKLLQITLLCLYYSAVFRYRMLLPLKGTRWRLERESPNSYRNSCSVSWRLLCSGGIANENNLRRNWFSKWRWIHIPSGETWSNDQKHSLACHLRPTSHSPAVYPVPRHLCQRSLLARTWAPFHRISTVPTADTRTIASARRMTSVDVFRRPWPCLDQMTYALP